jgi:menaquinone reductase, multiheme cytochrome c subunit
MSLYQFPRWTDAFRPLLAMVALGAPVYLSALFYYGASPKTLAVGYQPNQPVPFSHAKHAGELKMDCRYCHNTVEVAAPAAVPSASVCMNCHERILPESEKLALVREAALNGEPLEWVRVHDLPDYAYFNHSAHVSKGVSCVECHGRVDQMDTVKQVEPLSMGWCLSCHRDPAPRLRPLDQITNLGWVPENGLTRREVGNQIIKDLHINTREDCSTCHR